MAGLSRRYALAVATVTRARDAHSTDILSHEVDVGNEPRVRDGLLRVGDPPIVLTSFVPAPAASPS